MSALEEACAAIGFKDTVQHRVWCKKLGLLPVTDSTYVLVIPKDLVIMGES